jgi:hypothetical protein
MSHVCKSWNHFGIWTAELNKRIEIQFCHHLSIERRHQKNQEQFLIVGQVTYIIKWTSHTPTETWREPTGKQYWANAFGGMNYKQGLSNLLSERGNTQYKSVHQMLLLCETNAGVTLRTHRYCQRFTTSRESHLHYAVDDHIHSLNNQISTVLWDVCPLVWPAKLKLYKNLLAFWLTCRSTSFRAFKFDDQIDINDF